MHMYKYTLAVILFALLTFTSTTNATNAEIVFQDSFSRQDSQNLGNLWLKGNELTSTVTLPSGEVFYPGFIELADEAMVFRYENFLTFGLRHPRPYTYTPMNQSIQSGMMSFTFTPTTSGSVQHVAGLMQADLGFFERNAADYQRVDPVKGIAVLFQRTNPTVTNSSILLIKYDEVIGISRLTPDIMALPFQFEGGVTYAFNLTIADDIVSANISNGSQTVNVSAPLNGFTLEMDQVFIADHQGGDGGLRFDDIMVTPIPLPATVWLFGSGLLGLIGVGRRIHQNRTIA